MSIFPKILPTLFIIISPLFLIAQSADDRGWAFGPYLGYDLLTVRTDTDIRPGSVEEVSSQFATPRFGLSVRRRFRSPLSFTLDLSYQDYDFSEEKFLFSAGSSQVFRRWQYRQEKINIDLALHYFLLDEKTKLFTGLGFNQAINLASQVLRTYEFGDTQTTVEEDLPIAGSDVGLFVELGGEIGTVLLRSRLTFLDRTSDDRFYQGTVLGASLNYLF